MDWFMCLRAIADVTTTMVSDFVLFMSLAMYFWQSMSVRIPVDKLSPNINNGD